MDNNSVLMRVETDGRYDPIWCSREYTEMMEGTEEECIRYESGEIMTSIHPEDRDAVAYLFQNQITRDGANTLTIRKRTVKGNELWVNVHYAFVQNDGTQYAYCTYTNVTEIKRGEEQTKALYEGVRSDLDSLSHEALTFLRVNLTKDVLEDVKGRDVYEADRKENVDHVEKRESSFPALADGSLAVQRTNLTTGLIEESRGMDLYHTDYAGGSIAESARVRSESFLVEGDRERYLKP